MVRRPCGTYDTSTHDADHDDAENHHDGIREPEPAGKRLNGSGVPAARDRDTVADGCTAGDHRAPDNDDAADHDYYRWRLRVLTGVRPPMDGGVKIWR